MKRNTRKTNSKGTTRKMSAEDATRFEYGQSEENSTILEMEAASKGCECQPYQDWFTFGRWIAQGKAVKKGEHGVKISVYKSIEVTDKADPTKKNKIRIPSATTVFCRCQVQDIKPRTTAAPATEPVKA